AGRAGEGRRAGALARPRRRVDFGARLPGPSGAVVPRAMEGPMTQPAEVIQFYGTSDEYGCFSNFAHHPIRLKGRTWPTAEHYFQAQKFPGTEYEEVIRQAKSPTKAKSMGRSRK